MKFLYNLPTELFFLFKELPVDFLKHIQINEETLQNATFIQIVEDLIPQFKIIQEQQSFQEQETQRLEMLIFFSHVLPASLRS
ncbi:MAG: hypothetical protein OEY49_15255 [Candidatus Heimdallarchaeota archaeon]|nr:hypothetical protein [Candidatus Heimdallarchaeota archaeon]